MTPITFNFYSGKNDKSFHSGGMAFFFGGKFF